MTNAIDIDAIPLDLPKRQPAVAVYLATVETLPDGREAVMPHYGGPVWQWFGKEAPTLAQGPRGQGQAIGGHGEYPRGTGANVGVGTAFHGAR